MKTFDEKIKYLAELIEKQTIERLIEKDLGCETNILNAKTSIKPGKKYTKIDMGGSGRYMVVNATGEIFGIKAYGVIHRGHFYGTLDTVDNYYWGDYTAYKKG